MAKASGAFLEVARIQSEINHLFENLMALERGGEDGGGWVPNVDVVETADALLVRMELPGLDARSVRVAVRDGQLVVSGDRAEGEADGAFRAVRRERSTGRFRRSVHLGVPVNTRQAEAALSDGLLRIRFPKVPNRRGEEVGIEVTER